MSRLLLNTVVGINVANVYYCNVTIFIVATLCFFRLNIQLFVVMVWLVLDTKNTWSGLGKDHGALVTTNMTENYPKVTLKWFQMLKC